MSKIYNLLKNFFDFHEVNNRSFKLHGESYDSPDQLMRHTYLVHHLSSEFTKISWARNDEQLSRGQMVDFVQWISRSAVNKLDDLVNAHNQRQAQVIPDAYRAMNPHIQNVIDFGQLQPNMQFQVPMQWVVNEEPGLLDAETEPDCELEVQLGMPVR